MNLRTDLAIEERENRYQNGHTEGVIISKKESENTVITTIEIKSKKASEELKKAQGKYITLESEDFKLSDPESIKKASFLLKSELSKLIKNQSFSSALIVGLGNRNITSDSLGPQVISKIMVTKHIKDYMPEHIDSDILPVSAISPGVLGITGIETNEIINAISKNLKPQLIILIDALASSSPKRLISTIQITDTGISPGSGVGNNRGELSRFTLNAPVIAIGVPTVVDLLSIVRSKYPETEENDLEKDFFVTPKEIDRLIGNLSKIIANGINLSLHKNIDLDYIESFIS